MLESPFSVIVFLKQENYVIENYANPLFHTNKCEYVKSMGKSEPLLKLVDANYKLFLPVKNKNVTDKRKMKVFICDVRLNVRYFKPVLI